MPNPFVFTVILLCISSSFLNTLIVIMPKNHISDPFHRSEMRSLYYIFPTDSNCWSYEITVRESSWSLHWRSPYLSPASGPPLLPPQSPCPDLRLLLPQSKHSVPKSAVSYYNHRFPWSCPLLPRSVPLLSQCHPSAHLPDSRFSSWRSWLSRTCWSHLPADLQMHLSAP